MNTVGNLLWLIFGGIFIFLGYIFGGIILCLTIIGIPFGLQSIKIGMATLTPFGKQVRNTQNANGCLPICMNIIWIIFAGLGIAITHLVCGVLLCITIIGIPFGKQHFKLMALGLAPFGKTFS